MSKAKRLLLIQSYRQRKLSMEGTAVCTRIGRRGDPRMHRAVAARIDNPSLSLFHALQIGGFEYSNDDDPNVLDSEQVSLIQRKNQLSRRIRYALRQQNTPGVMPTKCCEVLKDEPSKDRRREERTTVSKRVPHASKHSEMDSLSNEELFESANEQSPSKRRRNALSIDMTEIESIIAEEIQKTIGVGSTELNSDGVEEQGHDWRSIISEPDEPIKLPPTYISPFAPSETLAVSSLHQTADSLGMNLEQLALLLSSQKNLATILQVHDPTKRKSNPALKQGMLSDKHDLDTANKHEAVLVHHHLQEALSAWKKEGQRLRQLITQCRDQGRTPILHQPVGNGKPHIDFLVDHCVECYSGILPKGFLTTDDAAGSNVENPNADLFWSNNDPILYDRNDIDWESDEWDLDLLRSDSLTNLLALNDFEVPAVPTPSTNCP